MKATAGIGLWGLTALTGFAVGMAIGKATNPEIQPRQPVVATTKKEDDPQSPRLLASLQTLRNTLSEKEQTADDLRAEIEEVQAKLLPPLSPEDEKWLRQEQEERRMSQRWTPLWKRKDELLKKILQRKDKALRAEGFDDLASLLESDKAEDKLVGLATLSGVLFEGAQFDRERFKPAVLDALSDEDWEVRDRALGYIGYLAWMGGDKEETARFALSMVNDPHPRVKERALGFLIEFGGRERNENIAKALRSLLQDGAEGSVSSALWAIDGLRYDKYRGRMVHANGLGMWVPEEGYDYYDEMKELVVEASRNPDSAESVLKFWWGRGGLDEDMLQRAAEILRNADPDERFDISEWPPECAELRELAYDHYFRVIRESLDQNRRLIAISRLERTEDESLIPELKSLAASEDAEGIERRLEDAIKRLERHGRDYR